MADPIVRAFELAKSGKCESIQQIEKTLDDEGHFHADVHLSGKQIRQQLNKILYDVKQNESEGPQTVSHRSDGMVQNA